MLSTPSRSITRTRNGCWTCRSRRKKCDEGRPRCQACKNLNLVCQGYGVRLKWSGRGRPHVRYNHQNRQSPKRPDTPQHASASPPSYVGYSGHDLILLEHLGERTFKTLSAFEREVLYDYAVWGSLTLFARPVSDPTDHIQEILTGCAQSKPMLTNCITYQITLDSKHAHRRDEYYAKSIALFRATLMRPDWQEDEMAPYAGVLLSTICVMFRGAPWTMHISGIASILLEQGYFDQQSEDSQCLAALIGTLDLPTHTLGRQTKHLHLWQKYCRDMDGIEELTGLPCTLVHLLAAATEPDIESRIENWTIDEIDLTMRNLWEASHQAGIIMVRQWRRDQNLPVRSDTSTDILAVTRILSLLEETHPQMIQYRMINWDNWLFPMIAAASHKLHLTSEGKAFVRECIVTLAKKPLGEVPLYSAIILALDTFWASNDTRSLQQVTRDLGLELALF